MKKENLKLPQLETQGEFLCKKRKTFGIDGAPSGRTRIETRKGKKGFKRKEANDPKNW
jgi:hypothetical protein